MKTDILVIGSGLAGLSFALKASKYAKILLITKKKLRDCNTFYAQGGLAAAFDKNDSLKLHIKDTLRAGDGLCNKRSVELLVKNAPKQILWLKYHGVQFDRQLSREAVHSAARIVHSGDITGERVENALIKKVKENNKIKILEDTEIVELIKKDNTCIGATILNNSIKNISAKATILATGGLGSIYKNTCNPEITVGEGYALAYNIGTKLQDMEFVQFHPTSLYGSDPTFLISETLRGEGGHLINKYDEIYMPKYHRDGELAPRDVVSKFTVDEMRRTKVDHVHLDVTHLGSSYLKKRFPKIYKKCLEYNIDLTRKPIPVVPTAHYSCGGIKINLKAETNIKNLFAIGETSCSGLHGADRLASNSLTDCLVFGDIVSKNLKQEIKKIKNKDIKEKHYEIINNPKNIEKIKKQIKEIMWDKVGIIRSTKSLNQALKELNKLKQELDKIEGINKNILELKNMLTTSILVTRSALKRKESRGTHFNKDFPKRNDKAWKKHSIINKNSITFR